MSDAAIPAPPPSVKVAPPLFALAIFTSAALVFVIQPMVTRLVLPQLGGSAAVWNTAMVFFQAALLAGYGYAHALQRVKSLRIQIAVHLALLLLAALFLPLRISDLLGEPDSTRPIVWLIGTLAVSIGAPFAVLCATAPLLQAWYARVRAGEEDAKNPYVLYAASNLGSFIALLAYPVLVEPLLALNAQTLSWSVGYGVFFVLAVTLGVTAWGARAAPEAAPLERSPAIPLREKAIWVLLAAAPSSLMLGVTQHLTTDVASAPFLWVVPLALYLLTFVIAFSARPAVPVRSTLLLQAAFISVCAWLLPFNTAYWAVLFLVHLGTFFLTALMCHQALAGRRPPPDRLTEFYLLLSLGGVLGGAFNALLAPVIFDTIREYPLVLLLAVLARPAMQGKRTARETYFIVTSIVLALIPPLLFAALKAKPGLVEYVRYDTALQVSFVFFFASGMLAFAAHRARALFLAALTVLTVTAHSVAGRYDWVAGDRSFFGVLRIARYDEPTLGEVKMLLHGTTLHGAQVTNPPNNCVPMLYYAEVTPLGQAMRNVQRTRPSAEVGVVGLGTGTMATYMRPGDRLTYYEIDPLVEAFARDPEKFSFLKCSPNPVKVVMGDARLSLAKEPAGKFDILIIDAFSSDAVPTHLLTVEALETYLRALKPDGVVVLHLSNRNLEITKPALAAAQAIGAPALHQLYYENPASLRNVEASTEAVVVSPTQAGLTLFELDGKWAKKDPEGVRPWTDDYTNLIGALWRDLKVRTGDLLERD